jgi:hypothetical protein
MLKPGADGWRKLRGFRVSRLGFVLLLAGMIGGPGRHGMLRGAGPQKKAVRTEGTLARPTDLLPGHQGNDDDVASFVRCLMAKKSVGTGEGIQSGGARISTGLHSPEGILANLRSGR